MRTPRGLREQPAWVFIGVMVLLTGLSYMTSFTESMVSRAIGDLGLRIWGALFAGSGLLLVIATVGSKASLEKLALRTMTCTLLSYAGYLMTVAPVRRAAFTVVLVLLLSGLIEFRVYQLKTLINRAKILAREMGAMQDGN
jgi:hypothetical protein